MVARMISESTAYQSNSEAAATFDSASRMEQRGVALGMQWEWYDAILWRPILTRAKWLSQLMRRKLPDGSWQYRQLTEDEMAEARNLRDW